MPEVTLDWSSAKVKDGTLSVELDGELPKGWKKSFESTVMLLGDGDWGKVSVRKGAVRVTEVGAGSEDKLRHFLESVVIQANADHSHDDEDESGDAREDETDDDGDGDGDEQDDDPDAELTDRFRSFAD
jgi:hypothetical protein